MKTLTDYYVIVTNFDQLVTDEVFDDLNIVNDIVKGTTHKVRSLDEYGSLMYDRGSEAASYS